MDKESIVCTIKNLVYEIVLPIYLWSIGYKTLDAYLTEVERQYEEMKEEEPTNE